MNRAPKRLAILGAGPMGLFAAFAAARRGLDVTVLERDRIGESLMSWGSARFFSPLDMNLPAGAREALPELPPGDALLTGPEMVARILLPLSRLPILQGRIRTRHRVLAVARAGLSREDFAGHPLRQEKPFRLLVEESPTVGGAAPAGATANGEYLLEADLVFDATGVYGLANGFGSGGLPALGERASGSRIFRRLGDLEAWLDSFRSGRILLVGHGHSAAHALLAMREAAVRHPGITVTWAFRSRNLRPFRETPDDPLPGRAAIVSAANALAASPPAFLDLRRGASVALLEPSGRRLRAGFVGGVTSAVEVDAVAAFTGYRPDLSILSELALDLSPAAQGTRRLHAVLNGASDCLSVPMPIPADLETGEAGFYLLGSKSYGRSGAFLLRDGIRHMEMILQHAL